MSIRFIRNLKWVTACVIFFAATWQVNAQAPIINYPNGTKIYTVGVPIAPLTPTNTGGSFTNPGQAIVSTIAGTGSIGSGNGTGTAATFSSPSGIAVDVNGNIYVADQANNKIRKISPTGIVTTFAGSGEQGNEDGLGTAASFYSPSGIAIDASGNLYVSELGNPRIRKIKPNGMVTTIAGSGEYGNADGEVALASFRWPTSLAVDGSGNIYVADALNNMIRKISPDSMVTTLAGGGNPGDYDDWGMSAMFNNPAGVAVDAQGNVFVADMLNHKIRKISPEGEVSTLAGSGNIGSDDGIGTEASFYGPSGVVVDAFGNVYVTDQANNKIRKITPDGVVTTLAGSGTMGAADGLGVAASFKNPSGIALNLSGHLYLTDENNHNIRKIVQEGYSVYPALPAGLSLNVTSGIISGTPTNATIATNYTVTATNTFGSSKWVVNIATILVAPVIHSYSPTSAGPGTSVTITGANFAGATAVRFGGIKADSFAVINDNTIIAMVGSGKSGRVSVATLSGTVGLDGFNYVSIASPNIQYADGEKTFIVGSTIAPLAPANTGGAITGNGQAMVTTLAGNLYAGYADGMGTVATFSQPTGVAVDADGYVYVADFQEHRVRKISPEGLVTTLAGNGTNASIDGLGSEASFNGPTGIAVDTDGNVYVADQHSSQIRKISPAGVVTTLAGNGYPGNTDGTGTAASFNNPTGVAVDAHGNVFVADYNNNTIRKISPAGEVTTLAGSGEFGATDGTGTAASFSLPWGIAVDTIGNVFVSDLATYNIRKISPLGVVTTLAGTSSGGSNDGMGTSASFDWPYGVAADANGHVYVADQNNFKIRIIYPSGFVSTLAGTGLDGVTDSIGPLAKFLVLYSVAVDFSGALYVADGNRIRKISPPKGYFITPALPEGLNFNGSTGIISGIPTKESPATDYTISAFNVSGSSSWVVNIATIASTPVIKSFLPTAAYSGSVVTIKGKSFTGATAVSFGGTAASTFNVLNDSTITAVVATGKSGSIKVTTGAGTDSLAGFSFLTLTSPNISYPGGVKIYTIGSSIVPLAPTNSGGFITGKEPVMVTTFAGGNNPGSADGNDTAARFNQVNGIAVDANGNVYVADLLNNKIRKINSSGVVSTLAGSGSQGSADGAGLTASFWNPSDVAVDLNGNVYVADELNNKIRKISPDGNVTTLAGNGMADSANGTGAAARFNNPTGLAVDAIGNVYVADNGNHKIRKISPDGVVTTLAGSGTGGAFNGPGKFAEFGNPHDVVVDAGGNVFVADSYNHRIRKITPGGIVSHYAGFGLPGSRDDTAIFAEFNRPTGVALDAAGNVFVADQINYKVRKISPALKVSTYAGKGIYGSANDTSVAASFSFPYYVAASANGTLYVSDRDKIRKITPPGGYFISPALPTGLKIDATTGIISGTPTIATNATNYTITATNGKGSSSWVISIATIAAGPPIIISINQLSGPVNTTVTIKGTNLSGASVSMSPNISIPVLNNTDTSLSVQIPATAISSVLKIVTSGGNVHTPYFTITNASNQLQHQQGQTLTLTAPDSSSSYQWQVNMGAGFVNILNNGFYSGATTRRLVVSNAPTSWSGYQYRVLYNSGTSSSPLILRFYNYVQGGGNWSNPAIWSAGAVPDQYTDVVVLGGGTLVVDVDATVRSLTVPNSNSVNVLPGIKLTITQ